jgi:transposase-like protein
LNAIKIRAAKAMLASGTMTGSEVARQVGCSSSTLYRHLPGGRSALPQIGMSEESLKVEPAKSRLDGDHRPSV